MGTVYLAANAIPGTLNVFGHLQLVFQGDNNTWAELEVQAPTDLLMGDVLLLGDWVFHTDGTRDHGTTEFVDSDGTILDPSNYLRMELGTRDGQTAEELWEAAINFASALSVSANGAEYDVNQNSNSFAFTLLEGLGYNASSLISQLSSVGPFPGASLNVLQDRVVLESLPGPGGDFISFIGIETAGSLGSDALVGGRVQDELFGLYSDDFLSGLGGTDLLVGSRGDDLISGGTGQDAAAYFDATNGVDVNLAQSRGVDRAGMGTDTLLSIEDAVGSFGLDNLTGDNGANLLSGLSGSDSLRGASGDDTLMGDAGNDTLRGDAGRDVIDGGSGNDLLWGGADADVFFFQTNDQGAVIQDFQVGVDFILIDSATDRFDQIGFSSTEQGVEMRFAGNTVLFNGVFQVIDEDHFFFA